MLYHCPAYQPVCVFRFSINTRMVVWQHIHLPLIQILKQHQTRTWAADPRKTLPWICNQIQHDGCKKFLFSCIFALRPDKRNASDTPQCITLIDERYLACLELRHIPQAKNSHRWLFFQIRPVRLSKFNSLAEFSRLLWISIIPAACPLIIVLRVDSRITSEINAHLFLWHIHFWEGLVTSVMCEPFAGSKPKCSNKSRE